MGEKDKIPGGTEHILVVEDDELVRAHLSNQLGVLGYRVTSAVNARSALAIIKDVDDIDLLLTDIVMPGGMNGSQLADEVIKARPDIKILFTSGYPRNIINYQNIPGSRVELLSKPYRRKELATKIRKALEQ